MVHEPEITSNRRRGPQDIAVVCLLMLVAGLLVFPRLGANCLWEDEANTAVVSLNIVHTGLPRASDGRNFVSLFADHRDVKDGLSIWQPWLPDYLAAGSIAVFGRNSFGARFPFALLFVVLVAASYSTFREIAPDRPAVAIIAAVLIAASVPLLLHARQCRYYVLAPLFGVLLVRQYLRFIAEPRPRHVALITALFTGLFNSFAPGAVILAMTLAVDLALRRPDRKRIRLTAIAALAGILANLPLFLYTRMWDRRFGVQPGYSSIDVFGAYFLRYLLTINIYFFPLVLIAAAVALHGRSIIQALPWNAPREREIRLFAVICIVQLAAFSLVSDYPFTRYLVGTAPFLAFLGAECIVALSGGRQWFLALLVIIVLATNLTGVLPVLPLRASSLADARWTSAGIDSELLDPDNVGTSYARGEISLLLRTPLGSPLADYVQGLLHPPTGPVDAIVGYLAGHARPDDRVKITYEDTSLMYHTDLPVVSATEAGPPAPEWIIQRHFNPFLKRDDAFLAADAGRYTAVELPIGDVQWNNQPDPLYHFYETPSEDQAPFVRILRREPF